MSTRRDLIAGAALGALALGFPAARALAQAPAGPTPRPLVTLDFYLVPSTADAAMSPSGKRIAMLRNRYTPDGVTSWIDVIDTDNPTAPPKSLPLGLHEANNVIWANENRLLIWVLYNVTHKGFETEEIVRVIAIDGDGNHPAVMFGNRGTSLEYIHNLDLVIDDLPDDPDHVLMAAPEPTRGLVGLFKVDVNSGDAVALEYGAPRTYSWLSQNGVPMIRLDDDRGAGTRIMARAPGESDWKFVRQYHPDQIPEFAIHGPSDKPGVFLATARQDGEDKTSIREVDLTTLKLGPPLTSTGRVDAGGVWLDSRRKLMATTWADDRQVYEFTEKAFAPHFAAIEKYFGPELSLKLLKVDDARLHYLGLASGPREPGIYFLYDRKTHAITELGPRHAHLTAQRLGPMHTLTVKTRDGAEVRAYLTAPASGAPGPLVVMPHGGPEARDNWGFEPWAQVLAAQGWWVLQPNFRGSGGYGLAFAQQGWRRWGDRMQEDVEDATSQAIAEFKLDASRVAIFGASYGGYAALMGAVRRPDFYKAVVSMAGISDLLEDLKWDRSQDKSDGKVGFEFWRQREGDPQTDEAALIKASPRRRAAEINAPVFLIHGFLDENVSVEQSKIMFKALTAAGKKVEYWEIPKQYHSPSTPREERERLERVVAFLKPYLG
jgi:dipeptidyl aminopeptidase/acylaminoacyl peptidase